MVRYAISDGNADTPQGAARLLDNARCWAAQGIECVQLRERSMAAGALLELATSLVTVLRASSSGTKLLVNGRPDIAIAAEADGVHLTARPGELTPEQVRRVFAAAGMTVPVVSISCHSIAQVTRAADCGADLILFGPVFEKRVDGLVVLEGSGLALLHQACTAAPSTPVLALGGVTEQNSPQCLKAGASGIAGIRLFQ
jgi:thiamine-phosphate pyrophosphorylase